MISFLKHILFLVIIAFVACKQSGIGVLPVDKMKVVLLHQIMAEEMVNNFYANRDTILTLDSLYFVSFDKVLKLNGIDSATFYESLDYYKADIEKFKELMDSTYAYADRLRQANYLKKDTSSSEVDKEGAEEAILDTTNALKNKPKVSESLVN